MALKYLNKLKRTGYWPTYEQARINDFRIVYGEIRAIISADKPQRRGRGRPQKLTTPQLYCLCTFAIAFDLTFRELECYALLLEGETIDHTNFSRWLSKLDETIISDATKKLHRRIIRKRRIEYIVDSTPFTLSFYREILHRGEKILERITWKLHVILAYLPVLGLLSVAGIYSTHGDAHDSPPFHDHLLPETELRKGSRLHGDAAYWGNDNLRDTKEKKIVPNFVPRKGAINGMTFQQAINEYDNDARKRFRGMVEGFFGGIATRQGTKCRYSKHQSKVFFTYAIAFGQQVRTYLRYKVATLCLYFRTNPDAALKQRFCE